MSNVIPPHLHKSSTVRGRIFPKVITGIVVFVLICWVLIRQLPVEITEDVFQEIKQVTVSWMSKYS